MHEHDRHVSRITDLLRAELMGFGNKYLHVNCFATVCETPKVLADHAALVSIASYLVRAC